MRQINRKVVIICILLLMFWTPRVYAQVLGNPINSLLSNEIGFGLVLETIHRPMNNVDFSSARLWLKGSYGINDWWTLCGMAGGANIYLDPTAGSKLTTFRGSFEWAYGGNTKVAVIKAANFELFGFGGGLRTFSSGMVLYDYEEEPIDLRYDWQELWGGGGILYAAKKWTIYGALEEKQVRWCETGSKERTISGIETNIIGGFEYNLTSTMSLNMQIKFLNEYSFIFGISEHNLWK